MSEEKNSKSRLSSSIEAEKELLQNLLKSSELSRTIHSKLSIPETGFDSRKQVLKYVETAFRDQHAVLESILNNTEAVIYVKDTEGRYLLVNQKYEKIFNMKREAILGKTDHELFPKEQADVFRRNDLQVIQEGKSIECEEVAPHHDGLHTYISIKFPIFDTKGMPYATAGISTDISDRKRFENALKDSKDYLDKLINSIADPIFVKDRQHRWVLLNDACCRFMGDPREKRIGKSDYEFFPKEEADVFWKKDEEVFNTGKENLNEENFTDAQGNLHTILTKKTLYVDSKGQQFIVGVIRDITEQKQAQKALIEKTHELAKASAEREYLELFAYIASHDLQEPLQKIIAFGGLLKSHSTEDLDEKGRGYVEKMQMAALRMSRMIEDLLQFTKVTMNEDVFESVDLEVVLGEALSDLDHKLSQMKAHIEIGSLPTVQADRQQMHQLFLNLLSNALKFQKKNQEPRIEVLSRNHSAGFVEIQIKDNGIGFEENVLARMFRPFERFHGRGEFEGSGIGLAICKRIVVRHGGKISAKSKVGEGSVFSILLPIGKSRA